MKADDASIGDSVLLYRRVHPKFVVWDGNKKRLRPASAAFKDDEMSVNLGDDLAREGLEPTFALRKDPHHHLCEVTAEYARQEEQAIVREPLQDHPRYGDDFTHGEVCGPKGDARRKRFALAAEWSALRRDSLKGEHQERFDEGDYPSAPDGDDAEEVAA
jgi:hypothetical protein